MSNKTMPSLGQKVYVRDFSGGGWMERIFITTSSTKEAPNGAICVGSNDEELFKDGLSFRTTRWDEWKHIDKKDESGTL